MIVLGSIETRSHETLTTAVRGELISSPLPPSTACKRWGVRGGRRRIDERERERGVASAGNYKRTPHPHTRQDEQDSMVCTVVFGMELSVGLSIFISYHSFHMTLLDKHRVALC